MAILYRRFSSSTAPLSFNRFWICCLAPMCVTPYTDVITVCFTSLRSTCGASAMASACVSGSSGFFASSATIRLRTLAMPV